VGGRRRGGVVDVWERKGFKICGSTNIVTDKWMMETFVVWEKPKR
jgi:hypothetical protein